MTVAAYIASAIFIVVYALIASEKVDKTKAALAGGALMMLVGLVDQHTAFHGSMHVVRGLEQHVEGIDWNTIFLLIGMMIIVNVTRHTGVFEWVAIKTAKRAHGRPIPILIGLAIATAGVSALLDNVTTVLLIAPAVILIYEALEVDPVPFLILIIMASNIGGTATLVGDPPNIMIASTAKLSFMDFLSVNGPIILIIFVAFALTIRFGWGRRMQVTDEQRHRIMEFDETRAITNYKLLWRCLFVIGLVLVGFVLHARLGLEPATVALSGAALIMLLHPEGPHDTLRDVEWPTIFFFIGLFIMVSGLVKVGVIAALGQGLINLTAGNPMALTMAVLGFSAVASAIIDNIPFVATMTALLSVVAAQLHPEAGAPGSLEVLQHAGVLPIWWALSLGAGLGGNMTLIGASPNVVVSGIAKRAGHTITFKRFLKYGVPLTLQYLVISALYLWFRFFR